MLLEEKETFVNFTSR